MWWFITLSIFCMLLIYTNWRLRIKRCEFIERFTFDLSIRRRIAEKYPHLTPSQIQQVLEGLRDYFIVVVMARGSGVLSMPSQAVDEAWHAFILSTKSYASFCKRAFGKFLHHHPAETMTAPTQATIGIKRTWNLICRHEGINAANPAYLPRLFALDAELKIANGFVYSLNCLAVGSAQSFCASDIGSGCGGSDGCSGDNGGDGSGCGGGCGGGD